MVLLAIVLTTVLFQRIPKAHELSIVEGPVTQAKWIGSRRARFVVWLDDHPSPFQPQPPKELPVPIADMIKPGMTARIGYTGASVGYFGLNNNLKVFALAIDGTDVYTLDDYAADVRGDRPGLIAFLLLSIVIAVWSFPRKRKPQPAWAPPPLPPAPPPLPRGGAASDD